MAPTLLFLRTYTRHLTPAPGRGTLAVPWQYPYGLTREGYDGRGQGATRGPALDDARRRTALACMSSHLDRGGSST